MKYCTFKSELHMQRVYEFLKKHGVPIEWDINTFKYNKLLFINSCKQVHSCTDSSYTKVSVTDFCNYVFDTLKLSNPILNYGQEIDLHRTLYRVSYRHLTAVKLESNDTVFNLLKIEDRFKFVSDVIGYDNAMWLYNAFPEVEINDFVALTMIYEALREYKVETKSNKSNMETQSITRGQLKQLYDIACESWKYKFLHKARENSFTETFTFTNEEVEEMFKAATSVQLPIVESMFKRVKPSLNIVTQFPSKTTKHLHINGKNVACIYGIEEQGLDKGFKASGHKASIFLQAGIGSYGQWYDENGNLISGYLHFKPNN